MLFFVQFPFFELFLCTPGTCSQPAGTDVTFPTRFAASFGRQLRALFIRACSRSPDWLWERPGGGGAGGGLDEGGQQFPSRNGSEMLLFS